MESLGPEISSSVNWECDRNINHENDKLQPHVLSSTFIHCINYTNTDMTVSFVCKSVDVTVFVLFHQ